MANTPIKSDVMQAVVMGSIAEGSKPATVTSAKAIEVVLNQKQLATVGETVNLFIDGDEQIFQGDEKHIKVATVIAKLIKPESKVEPTYAFWNLVADTWQNVYMSRNQIANEESAKNAWYRNAKRMEKLFGLVKPKAPSADASRMSEKRKAEQAELQAKPDSVIREEMLAYKAEDTKASLAKATKLKGELERRENLTKAPLLENRKAKQALLSKAMKKIENDDLLNEIWALVPQSIKLEIAQSK
jgi:hypothetical protein